MKKFILILLVLSACVEDISPTYPEAANGRSSRSLTGCDYAYQFGLNGSTITTNIILVNYTFQVKTPVVGMTDGSPLWGMGAKTSRHSTLTYKVWNTGASTLRYRVNLGSWVNILPSSSHTFTRLTYLRNTTCTSEVSVPNFNVNVERVNCGTMPPTNQFACDLELISASNAYTIGPNHAIGFTATSQNCPL